MCVQDVILKFKINSNETMKYLKPCFKKKKSFKRLKFHFHYISFIL